MILYHLNTDKSTQAKYTVIEISGEKIPVWNRYISAHINPRMTKLFHSNHLKYVGIQDSMRYLTYS